MRRIPILILSTLIAQLVACNNSNTDKAGRANENQKENSGESKNGLDKKVLLKELKNLQRTLASNDKEQIAGIFQFPVPDSSLSIYIDDSTYNEELKANGNRITKPMFLKHYKEISANILLDQLNNLFQYIRIDRLLYKDTLTHDAYIKTQPCFYSYQIDLNNDIVVLSMNMNSNKQYKSSKTTSKGDVPENSSEICEHNNWWTFRFDGKKLRLVSISGAD